MILPLTAVRAISEPATHLLIATIWQGTLLAVVAAVGLRLLPKTPASARFAVWFAVFAAVVALPFLRLGHGGAAKAVGDAGWLTLRAGWSLAILALWAAASAVRAGMLAVGAVRVRSLWRRATPIELPAAAALTASGRSAQICTSDEVDRPSVIGFFAPKILIPGWLLDRLTPEEIAHVVLHEAGHLGRADDWLNLLQKLALVVFPLNPALFWIERRLCFERELACDERVLHATGAPKAYASCPAALAEHRMNRRSAALVMAALGRESDLGERVTRILARGEHMRPLHARLLIGTAVLMLSVGSAGLERCPELVGFSEPMTSAALDSAAPSSMLASVRASGFRPQAVVFRPGSAHASNLMVRQAVVSPSHAAHATAAARRVVPAVSRTPLRKAVPAAAEGRLVRTAAPRPQTAPAVRSVQWIVLTAWTATDGERVVMTSFTASSTASPARSPLAVAGPGAAQAGARQWPAQAAAQAQEFSSTAAVPVRGRLAFLPALRSCSSNPLRGVSHVRSN